MKKRRVIQGALGVFLAGIGLYIFFRQSFGGDEAVFAALAREVAHTSVTGVAVCVVLAIVTIWLRAMRLKIILPDEIHHRASDPKETLAQEQALPPKPHKRGFFSIVMISFMANNILPARLGEAARVALLWKRNGFPIAVGLGSLIIERTLDIVAYLSFLFIPVLLSPTLSARLRDLHPAAPAVIWLSAAAFAAFSGVLLLYALAPRIFRRTAAFLLRGAGSNKLIAKVKKIGAEAELSIGWIFSPRKAAGVFALTYAISFCFSTTLWALVFDMNVFGVLDSMFAQAFAAFGSAIPLAPGSVGTLHAALFFGLTATGLEAGRAGAVAIVYHGLQYIVVTAFGLLLLAGLHIKFKDITETDVR
ncbi:MAG: flippase-like domain-containing protein [Chitinispirillales bacterium]|jgi:uncharacterized protein (TIRG00374 family)|nr:flippase-like domain-containing protein [Chitinispirillales bacterium]